MYVNDDYVVELIMIAVSNHDNLFSTPNDYCVSYTYEETHSITLEDLRNILVSMFKKKEG